MSRHLRDGDRMWLFQCDGRGARKPAVVCLTINSRGDLEVVNIVPLLKRSMDVRESGVVAPDQVVDLQFAEFMVDPFGTIRTIYDRLDLELTAATEQRMRDFLAANPKGAHGVHHYTWDATELEESTWRDRAQRYQEYFAVPSESLD